MELTGAENVELYATVMGLSRKQLALHYEEIIEVAGIREFIEVLSNITRPEWSPGLPSRWLCACSQTFFYLMKYWPLVISSLENAVSIVYAYFKSRAGHS